MTQSYQPPRNVRQSPWRKRLILLGCLAVLVFCAGLLVGYLKNRDTTRLEPAVVNEPSPLTREVTLYFASADGQNLSAEVRKLSECQNDEDCLRDTIEALIDGPQSDLVPILGAQVVLRSVNVTDSLLTADFSQEMMTTHPGGTQSEMLTIYGLVDTLVVNFPHLRQVQFWVEGSPVQTLKGHVDLRQPINPDFGLVKEGLPTIGTITESLPAERDE